jgi:hypothetical protein
VWHLGVVLLDVELDQGAEPLERVQGVEVEPLVLERAPEGFDHRIREGEIDLGKHAVETRGQRGVMHGGVHVFDTGVRVEQRSAGRDEMLASGE